MISLRSTRIVLGVLFFRLVTVQAQEQAPPSTTPPPPLIETNTASPVTSDDARVQQLQVRFQQGYALQQADKLAEARTVYDRILAEEPKARRSLLEAGRISLKLGEYTKASGYLEKLYNLEPTFPAGLEMYIQASQALGQDVKIERLRGEFKKLFEAGKTASYYVRERIRQPGDSVVVMSEFFDYTAEPNTLWMAEQFDSTGNLLHRILLNFDPAGTKELQAKDPRLAKAQTFLLLEDVMKDGKVTVLNVYDQFYTVPDYRKTRAEMIGIITKPPKPVYSTTVDKVEAAPQ